MVIQKSIRTSIRSAMGNTPVVLPEFDYLMLGTNLAWVNNYSGAWPFANIMWHAAMPALATGSGAFTFDGNVLTAAVSTDIFRFQLSDLPARTLTGTYTILNPDGCQVYLGGYTAPSAGQFSTATVISVDITNPTTATCFFVRGSLTANAGSVKVILPGCLDSWNAGDIFNPDFVAYCQDLKLPFVRTMDWTQASESIEMDWADRTLLTDTTFKNYQVKACVPYEAICKLAERLSVDVWVCTPARASSDYVQKMAELFRDNLPAGRKVWVELANEIWNLANPWGANTTWITTNDFTRKLAVGNSATGNFTLASHGLSNGNNIVCSQSKENLASGVAINGLFYSNAGVYAKVVDADNFEVYTSAALTTKLPAVAGHVNLRFVNMAEPGKSSNMNLQYALKCLENWATFDAVMGASRIKKLLAGQSANPSVLQARLAVQGVLDAVDEISIAPYFDGLWGGGSVDISSGQLLPKFWATQNCSLTIAVYASGATPSIKDIIAGTGAISKQTLAYTGTAAAAMTSGTAVTGLTNGTAYKVFFVAVDTYGEWVFSCTPTVSATTSILFAYSSEADQELRSTIASTAAGDFLSATKLLAPTVPLTCYEGGPHYHQVAPAEIEAWMKAFMRTAAFGRAVTKYLNLLAANGAASFFYYADCLGNKFVLSDNYTDKTDGRFLAYEQFAGKVKKIAKLPAGAVTLDDIESDPAAFPQVLWDSGIAGLSGTVTKGDPNGNYSFTDGKLLIVNDSGINWGAPANVALEVFLDNGLTVSRMTFGFATGFAWFETDARYAWDSILDADSAEINPSIGAVATRQVGPGAVVSGGLWNMDGNVYKATTGLLANLTLAQPFLLVAVFDPAAQPVGFASIIKVGSGTYVSMVRAGSPNAFGMYSYVNPTLLYKAFPAAPAGVSAFWIYYDAAAVSPAFHLGINQTDGDTQASSYAPSSNFGRQLQVGGDGTTAYSKMLHGSFEVVSRAGMTLSQAKAIVAKVQEHHGII